MKNFIIFCFLLLPAIACSKFSQQSATVGQSSPIKTVFCHCEKSPYSHNSPFNFLKPMINTFIPCVYASVVTSEWVIGEGASFELAKQSAKKTCEKGKNTYLGTCYEGTFVANCSCQKIVDRKDPTKIGLKGLWGLGSAYTEKEAIAKAKTDCMNSHSGGVEVYDRSSFQPPFKGAFKITECSLLIQNKKIISN